MKLRITFLLKYGDNSMINLTLLNLFKAGRKDCGVIYQARFRIVDTNHPLSLVTQGMIQMLNHFNVNLIFILCQVYHRMVWFTVDLPTVYLLMIWYQC